MKFFSRIKSFLYNCLDWGNEEKFISNLHNLFEFHKLEKRIQIKSIPDTIHILNTTPCSMARFGDGEIKVIFGGGNEFQKPNNALAARLKEILISERKDNMIICIPNIREYQKTFNKSSLWFWNGFIRKYGKQLATIFTPPAYRIRFCSCNKVLSGSTG